MTENKRFKQLTEKGFTHAFLDTKNLNISYICDNSNDCKNIVNLLNDLNEENEQLKQFKSKVLELLDEKIKHYEHKPFSAPVGQAMSVNFDADMDRIARLSELQCLQKELEE